MVTTYTQFSKKTASQKVGLIHIHGKEEVKVFASNAITMLHTKTPRAFVTEVELNGVSLTRSSTTPTAGEFNYSVTSNLLTIFFDGTIADQEVILTYRFFFSNFPAVASYDLTDAGDVVEYKPLVRRIPGFSTNIQFAKSNKTVTGSGTLTLDNNDGFFNDLIRNVRFDNKLFTAYSWNPDLAFSEHKTIYSGITNSANIQGGDFRLGVKDTIFTLNNQVPVTQFTSSEVIAAHTGRFKKTIYGRVNGMALQSISQIGDGYPLTGSIQGNSGSNIITGTGTEFLSELAPRDVFTISGVRYTIRKIVSDTLLLLTDSLTINISATNPLITPSSPWFNTNRTFSVSSHSLKKFSTTITGFIDTRRIQVASSTGFAVADEVIILNETYTIAAISKVYTDSPTNTMTADVIVLDRTLSSNNFPVLTDTIETKEVSTVSNDGELLVDNDITVDNNTTGANITITADAEQNVADDGFFEGVLTSVLDTNYLIRGVPFINRFDLTLASGGDFRGSFLRLAKKEDTTTASGPFIWMSTTTEIRQFTTATAATVNFEAGDVYQLTDGDMNFFGVRTAGINMNHQDLGDQEPTLVILDDTTAIDFDLTSQLIKIALDDGNFEQLFSFGSSTGFTGHWTLCTNDGTVGFSNTLSLGTASNITSTTTTSDEGIASPVDVSLSQGIAPRDLVRLLQNSSFSIVVDPQASYIQIQGIFIATATDIGIFRNPKYITDTSLLTCSAFGQTFDNTITGSFIKTPSDAVLKILQDTGLTDSINSTSFTEAAARETVDIGIYTPYKLTSKAPTVNDLINRCTISGLGALGLDGNFQLKYVLLNGSKPTILDSIRLIENNEVTNRAVEVLTPSPLFRYTISNIEADFNFGENDPNSTLLRIVDPKIERLTDLSTTETVDLYLRNPIDANTIADRFLNYSQKFNKVISFNGSLGLSDVDIGDIVLVDLLELREDSISRPFLGMVTSFSRDANRILLSIDDFGDLFLTSANISDNSSSTFTLANDRDKLLGTFLTDDNGLIDNDETVLGNYILP